MNQFKNFLTLGTLSLFLTFMPSFPALAGSSLYKYTDKKGTVHFTDRYESIPQEYRDQIKTFREEPPSPSQGLVLEGQEGKKEGEIASGKRTDQGEEIERKEAEKREASRRASEEEKLKTIQAKEKQVEELQKEIEDKQKQQRSLRTNWMVHDRNIIIRLNHEIAELEKRIKVIQNELAESK
jgi:pyruvate/oxaloacetate carboxyltransferase